jgi:hypothetical protein
MAYFIKPLDSTADGYEVDNKSGPGSLWRVTVPLGSKPRVALTGGGDLVVSSNNDAVVPNDRLAGLSTIDGLQIVEAFGRSEGTSMLEAKDFSGNVVAFIQIAVTKLCSLVQFVKPRGMAVGIPVKYETNSEGAVTRMIVPLDEWAYVDLAGKFSGAITFHAADGHGPASHRGRQHLGRPA